MAAAEAPPGSERIRASDVIGSMSLAADLELGSGFEHALRSTLFAMRLAASLSLDRQTLFETYYAGLLMHNGCTADVHIRSQILGDPEEIAVVMQNVMPVWFGAPRQTLAAILRSVAPDRPPLARAAQLARTIPRAAREIPSIEVACREVAGMLSARLGLPPSVSAHFAYVDERWDGKGDPGDANGDELPLAIRLAHVGKDADIQSRLGGPQRAAQVVRDRAGAAFDPQLANHFADNAEDIVALDEAESVWEQTLACEPAPHLTLEGDAIEGALSAMGDFADLVSPYLAGHSAGVAELATAAAERCRFSPADVTAVRRAALVHDVGRVGVPVRVWQHPGPLTPDDWERVRLHAYHSERILCRSPFLAQLAPLATAHHERLDGSGYHRGAAAATLTPPARVLAAADAYHAMTEPRPHRAPLTPEQAAETLGAEAKAGKLDVDAVAAVLEAAGHRAPRIERPAGLTEREAQVVCLLARGLQTKQVANALGISVKTADRHIQNTYAKIGVSTRAGATLFAMQHGFTAWGELPIAGPPVRS